MTDRRRHPRWTQAERYLPPVRRSPWLALVAAGMMVIVLNAAPRTVTGDEMVGQPIQPERALLPTLTDAKPARERPSSSVAAPYKRFAALQGRSDKGPRGSGQFDSGSPAVAAPRFVAPARRDREDAFRGKLLDQKDYPQAWHSGRGAAPSCASYTGLIPADATIEWWCIRIYSGT